MMKLCEQICKSFNRQAGTYEKNALMQKEVGERMLARLAYLKMRPQTILDLGCGSGYFSVQLKALYPDAQVVGLDFSKRMLWQAQSRMQTDALHRDGRMANLVCADIMQLPFADQSFDFIFSNQVVHWTSAHDQLFQEIYRVLKPSSCFFFSTLGPDSFKELNIAWEEADNFAHAHDFPDMHDVGDELLRQHFLDPVMDRDELSIHYPSVTALLRGLQAQGVRNIHPNRNQGLTTPRVYRQLEQAYAQFITEEGLLPLSYEVIQGHAWKGQQHIGKNGTEIRISVESLSR